jgi:hypothetical protein
MTDKLGPEDFHKPVVTSLQGTDVVMVERREWEYWQATIDKLTAAEAEVARLRDMLCAALEQRGEIAEAQRIAQVLAGRVTEQQATIERLRRIAGHALSDLRVLGVDIHQMLDITPEYVTLADEHDRDSASYS